MKLADSKGFAPSTLPQTTGRSAKFSYESLKWWEAVPQMVGSGPSNGGKRSLKWWEALVTLQFVASGFVL
jgi:hypothetical protein